MHTSTHAAAAALLAHADALAHADMVIDLDGSDSTEAALAAIEVADTGRAYRAAAKLAGL